MYLVYPALTTDTLVLLVQISRLIYYLMWRNTFPLMSSLIIIEHGTELMRFNRLFNFVW